MTEVGTDELSLLPHQRALIDQVLGAPEGRCISLEALPGMGKTTALVRLAVEAVRRDPHARVLFVAPMASLVDHFVHVTSKLVRATKVDRFAFREMLEREGNSALFKAPGLYGLTLQLAQSSDVGAWLTSAKWDLLICDGLSEVTDGSRLSKQLDELIASSVRTVVAGYPSETVASRRGGEIVRWSKADVVDLRGNFVGPPEPNRVVLPYPVSEELLRLLNRARGQGTALDGAEGTFAEALESSPAAAEMLALEQEARAEEERAKDPNRVANAILREIETLHADDKLGALSAYVRGIDLPGRGGRICVATRFTQTAYYLSSALTEIAPVDLYLASYPRLHTDSVETAPILVGGLMSLGLRADLASVDHLIFYDSAESMGALQLIEAANALGRSTPLTVAILRPSPRTAETSDEEPAAET